VNRVQNAGIVRRRFRHHDFLLFAALSGLAMPVVMLVYALASRLCLLLARGSRPAPPPDRQRAVRP